jgi:hypothetical protein
MKPEKAKADTTSVPSCIEDQEVDRDVLGLSPITEHKRHHCGSQLLFES